MVSVRTALRILMLEHLDCLTGAEEGTDEVCVDHVHKVGEGRVFERERDGRYACVLCSRRVN